MIYLFITMALSIGFVLMGILFWVDLKKDMSCTLCGGVSFMLSGLYLAITCDIASKILGF